MSGDLITPYLHVFPRRALGAISTLLSDETPLHNRFAGKVTGGERVLEIFRAIFDVRALELTRAHRHVSAGGSMAPEFTLAVTDTAGNPAVLAGIDLFEFPRTLICGLRAYADVVPDRTA